MQVILRPERSLKVTYLLADFNSPLVGAGSAVGTPNPSTQQVIGYVSLGGQCVATSPAGNSLYFFK